MSELKLYEVHCSVNFYIEVEAENEDNAKSQAIGKLESNGVYDINCSTSPVYVESINEVE
jgi:hypothetical protein